MDATFFESSILKINTPTILLIDASGSTRTKFEVPGTNETVFDRMCRYAKTIPSEQFRVIFWNSNCTGKDFPGGVIKFPHVIKLDALNQPFMLAKGKITDHCLTYPHLGFQNIDPTWIDLKEPTHIYFLTDGQITPANGVSKASLEKSLGDEIRNIVSKNSNIQLHIISFQNERIDFSRLENMNNMVGNDVYNTVSRYQLTKSITEFTTFTPNKDDGYTHIQNLIVPKGFVSYGTQYFYEQRMPEFTRWIYHLIQDNKNNEQELLKIIQKLSITVQAVTIDKPKAFVENITNTFCNMFHDTVVDIPMATFILMDAIQKDVQGQAFVYVQYRQQLKELFQQAQKLLYHSTKNAIGITGQFVSLPIHDTVITGHHSLVTQNCRNANDSYPSSSVSVQSDRYAIPVLPMNPHVVQDNSVNMQEQCMRQYLRMVFSKMYGIDIMNDIMMYMMMGISLRAVLVNNTPDNILSCYRKLSTVMLHKRRQHSDMTELDRIEQGNLPTPNNGKITDFHEFMRKVRLYLFQNTLPDLDPMTMWYALCLATSNEKLINNQLIHCVDSIKNNFPDLVDPKLLLERLAVEFREKNPAPMKVVEIQPKLDYSCIITLENTEATGGYIIKSHISMSGQTCTPMYVLSEAGYKSMTSQPNIWCPQCYQELKVESFDKVGPMNNNVLEVFDVNLPNPFEVGKAYRAPNVAAAAANKKNKNNKNNNKNNQQVLPVVPVGKHQFGENKTVVLVLMAGTIGAGKTTFSAELEGAMKQKGWAVINEGTDKYVVTGLDMNQSVAAVEAKLENIKNMPDDKILVIIDTCGQSQVNPVVFGTDFSGCKMIKYYPNYNPGQKELYMAWTLRNILNRGPCSAVTPFWINPAGAGVKTCVDVHLKKAQMAIGYDKKLTNKLTIDEIRADIDARANNYQVWLNEHMKMDDEIAKLAVKILE